MKSFSTERWPSIFSTVFIHSFLLKRCIVMHEIIFHWALTKHFFHCIHSLIFTKKTHRDAWNHYSTERSPSIFSTVFIHSFLLRRRIVMHETIFHWAFTKHFFHCIHSLSLTKKTHRDAWNHFPLSVHQAFFPLYSFTQFLLRRRIVMHETIFHWAFTKHFFHCIHSLNFY